MLLYRGAYLHAKNRIQSNASHQIYWWSKNPATPLDKNVLFYDLRIRIFLEDKNILFYNLRIRIFLEVKFVLENREL